RSLVLADEAAREDVAVAGPVLQRNPPLPPRLAAGRAGVGGKLALALGRHRERAVAGQPLRPFLERDAEGLAEDQRAEARAVDEEVAGDDLPRFQAER